MSLTAEAGLTVAHESGLQLFAGTPESYDARPLARGWFLGGVYTGAARTAEVPLSIDPGH